MGNRTVVWISSMLVAASYCVFALLAWLNFPGGYSPARNWLSDLGSRALNPGGAGFYNAGILSSAACLLGFFLAFPALIGGEKRIQKIMARLAQVFGALGCAAMALTALYTIDQPQAHSLFSAGLYIGLGTGFGFSVAALRYEAGIPRWLLGLGALTTLVDLLTSVFFSGVPVLEWVTVALFLGYVLAVGRESRQ